MRVQVLTSVMHHPAQDNEVLQIAEKMHLDSDAIIINQSDCTGENRISFKDNTIVMYSFPERGVGRSRNEAILRADSDICLFSDEDIVYEEGYAEAIAAEFERNPKADMILFNIAVEESRKTYEITSRKRVHWYNNGRYGAVSFAVRCNSLLASGVTFSLLFGGGARFSNGEDSLFLKEFMQKGFRVYTAPVQIGREVKEDGESTWFDGYHRKFFYDRGVLYHYLYGCMALPFALRFLLVRRKRILGECSISQAFRWMREGVRDAWKKVL